MTSDFFNHLIIFLGDSAVLSSLFCLFVDTAGQERFHTLSTSYFRGAQGFVLVYDITNMKSFQSITIWMNDIYETSAKENVNIEHAFSVLTKEILEKNQYCSCQSQHL
uniref:small monomeric GTPase n=1 Tax=Catharus ustulatus TaxID=91951 RepID=A0A8C3XY80_CATUS